LYNEVLDHNRINQLSSLLPAYQYQGSRVVIRGGKKPALLFSENGSYTLRKKDTEKTILVKGIEAPFSIGKTWQLHFQPDRGAPLQASMNELISLHRHPDPGIRYYSGTVRYITSFIPPKQLLTAGKYLELDLGRVEIIAEVLLNGKNIGLLWKPPFRIPIHHQIKEGTNHLEIRVTNLWPNRLIGDEQLPDPDLFTAGAGASGLESLSAGAIEKLPGWYMRNQPKPRDGRICFSTWKHYTNQSPLLESGLIGPVAIYSSIEKTLD
ncbi:MAG TPA: hypothetical protein VFX58_02190, partial [Chitinophagaceae bacterium]|nr:hypothetical protein [Chitinophagaceae bacterium]